MPAAKPSRLAPLILALSLSGCGGPSSSSDGGPPDAGPGPVGCQVTYSGDYQDHAFLDGGCALLVAAPTYDGGSVFPECSALAPRAPSSASPDWILQLQLPSPVIQATTTIQLDLGPAPSPGSFSASTVQRWCALAISPVGCEFSAGSESASMGSFQLTLTSVAGLESGAGTAHGSLEVQQYVQAPSATICGASNSELIHLEF
jgi:hypothetical protein